MTRDRLIAVLAVVAVLAAAIGGYFAWLSIFRQPESPVRTTTVVNRTGGYTLQVPVGMTVRRQGKATVLVDKPRRFSVTVTTTASGAPRTTNQNVVTAMHDAYRTVTVLASKRRTVDHRAALATYGAVVTNDDRKLGFVLVTVRGKDHNYALSTFAPLTKKDGDDDVQRRFDAVVHGFRVGVAKK